MEYADCPELARYRPTLERRTPTVATAASTASGTTASEIVGENIRSLG